MQSKEFSGKTPKTQNNTSLDLSGFACQLLVAKMFGKSGGKKTPKAKEGPETQKKQRKKEKELGCSIKLTSSAPQKP
jgi:hypothetical protein